MLGVEHLEGVKMFQRIHLAVPEAVILHNPSIGQLQGEMNNTARRWGGRTYNRFQEKPHLRWVYDLGPGKRGMFAGDASKYVHYDIIYNELYSTDPQVLYGELFQEDIDEMKRNGVQPVDWAAAGGRVRGK
jgi:hypothetical protein